MHKTTVIDKRCTQPNQSKNPGNLSFTYRSYRYILAFLPLALILLISTSYQKNPGTILLKGTYYSPEIRNAVNAYIQNTSSKDTAEIYGTALLNTLYTANHFAPLWTYHGIEEKGRELVYLIEHAREFGLEPENYCLAIIRNKMDKNRKLALKKEVPPFDPELEVTLSKAALKLMIHLHAGYRNPDSALHAEPWIKNLPELLIKGVYNEDLYETILSVEPRFVDYRNLRQATQGYVRARTLSDSITDIRYPAKDTVLLMDEIREALISLGYMTSGNNESARTALTKFQELHGLTPDGKPGANTIEALRKSTLYRYRILALNLDRLRKKDPSDTAMIYVNIPAYRLKIYDGRHMIDTFRVIVGNPSTPTPQIAGDLKMIIANPVWYVPRNIAMNEILPKIKEDSAYLSKNGFSVLDRNYKPVDASAINLDGKDFEFTFRQNSGSDNSLGQVKFLFSNPYAIYLHDTPGKQLFQKDIRAFSHGCIRVEHPEELASLVLNRMKADTADFNQVLKTGQQREYQVTVPLKVKITYVTCEANAKGQVYFYNDIYRIDEKELIALGI